MDEAELTRLETELATLPEARALLADLGERARHCTEHRSGCACEKALRVRQSILRLEQMAGLVAALREAREEIARLWAVAEKAAAVINASGDLASVEARLWKWVADETGTEIEADSAVPGYEATLERWASAIEDLSAALEAAG